MVLMVKVTCYHIGVQEEPEITNDSNTGHKIVRLFFESFIEHFRQDADRAEFEIHGHASKHIGTGLCAHGHKRKTNNAHMNQNVIHSGSVMQYPHLKQ